MLRPSPLAFVALLVAACATGGTSGGTSGTPPRKEQPMVATAKRPTPWTLTYADGSANVYRLTQPDASAPIHFEYVPVRPEQSSSGMYSGGDPKQADFAADDARVDEVWRRVEALEGDHAIHTEERAKRTGRFGITTPAGERGFIVRHSPPLTDFDEFLSTFRR
jgi:hypothetical protein